MPESSNPEKKKEKRKNQVRDAQRRFRAKKKEQEEQERREAANRELAQQSYTSPDAEQLHDRGDLSGLPWGGMSLAYMMQSGQTNRGSSDANQGTTDNTSSETKYGESKSSGDIKEDAEQS
ncbi:hypothetical protein BT63DRAFT_412398 [Microthyrium microscopicum]|uniref:BZIP domain-containing protein n=1 Tax=Microthyrium microscopicum TaxID=703497 RepID=A0A6A6UGF9_9PEZI|nr:hypothetical protein BT63DRAFT_412398 [Microthyrium microscopicum]